MTTETAPQAEQFDPLQILADLTVIVGKMLDSSREDGQRFIRQSESLMKYIRHTTETISDLRFEQGVIMLQLVKLGVTPDELQETRLGFRESINEARAAAMYAQDDSPPATD